MTFVRGYLRASTEEQNATRAKGDLEAFVEQRGLKVAAWYIENESGASLHRPKLFELLEDSHPGDILLIEQVDRLSRLNDRDWESLKRLIGDKRVKVVALDLPTSHNLMGITDEFTARMLEALNAMLLDMLAAISRKDYTDRRRRQSQGIADVLANPEKKSVKYKGRTENTARNERIMERLKAGDSWSDITKLTGASKGTLAKLSKRLKEQDGIVPV